MTRNKFKVTPFDRTGKLTTTLYLFTGVSWVVLSFLFAPRGYLVSSEEITIRALVTSYDIHKSKIKRVEIVDWDQVDVVGRALRLQPGILKATLTITHLI